MSHIMDIGGGSIVVGSFSIVASIIICVCAMFVPCFDAQCFVSFLVLHSS